MQKAAKLSRLAKYAWFVLGFNILVILWGVFLRASKSGDGCGQHWITCHGEVIPSAPELKTVIEFTHRITSSLAGILIIVLLVWAFRRWKSNKSDQNRLTLGVAVGSFIFVVIEGLLGAGLVLTGNTAENLTPERPLWMAAHLINTFILLAFLTLTARYASGGKRLVFRAQPKYLLAIVIGVIAIFLVGTSGSIAALSHMIFPAGTIAEGVAQDFSQTSHFLLRLRLLHPITAILTSVFLIFLTGWLAKEGGNGKTVSRWSNILSILILAQIAFGATTLLMLAPMVMQLGHLLLADLICISYILFSAEFLSSIDGTEGNTITAQEL
ncbi:MAG: COX15/CtaA family protein [Chloracidobacterium sp.]|nr:COX15/CtaA family protein [Chloracidobacterium sp.]